ncbi:MAG: hypothetical protein KBT88_00685 [Gammaproteobacteria bacterium]|nr:hypothetical protein [Gammaproteobacteria bacterium]MBQ0838269.1 hypothetical protein [Gammaproteobacteria bacterium]
MRDRTRTADLKRDASAGTVSASQALELTLTLVEVAPQMLQTWIRTAATIDEAGRVLSATLCSPEKQLLKLAQRVRAFPPDSKSSVYQARIAALRVEGDCLHVDAKLAGQAYERSPLYVMEIITQRGQFLAIPSEAIIEEGERQIVYVYTGAKAETAEGDVDVEGNAENNQQQGQYVPRQIHRGLQGELYTEVLHGLKAGEQVVTLGSFFIDADYKLKSSKKATMSNAHHHH